VSSLVRFVLWTQNKWLQTFKPQWQNLLLGVVTM
jgi:hypothetical protein